MDKTSKNSMRVSQGGIFHNKKPVYSPETRHLLQELLDESRLTMLERSRVSKLISNGGSLPTGTDRQRAQRPASQAIHKKPALTFPRRRSYNDILQSGVLQPQLNPPILPLPIDRAKEKARLQRLMTYGKSSVEVPEKKTHKNQGGISKVDMLKHIVEEMKDRENFLKEMEKLGRGKEYRGLITAEIQEKMQQMITWDRLLGPLGEGKERPSSAGPCSSIAPHQLFSPPEEHKRISEDLEQQKSEVKNDFQLKIKKALVSDVTPAPCVKPSATANSNGLKERENLKANELQGKCLNKMTLRDGKLDEQYAAEELLLASGSGEPASPCQPLPSIVVHPPPNSSHLAMTYPL